MDEKTSALTVEGENTEAIIALMINDVEYVKLTPEGFFVKGEKVEDKHDVYNGFFDFLVEVQGLKDTRKNNNESK